MKLLKALTAPLISGIGLFAALAWLLVMSQKNSIPVDSGDGLVHYAIARQSWNNTQLFIDHWGKPLFTLLSSPFAQGGFQLYVGFNILIFALTCIVAFRIFDRFELGKAYYWFFPLLLIIVPDYSYCVLGGMTEVLFAFLVVLSLYFAFSDRWILFALVVSFTPFARSEGMMILPLAFLLLILFKKWKFIPFLVTGFVIYAIAGVALGHDYNWYFTENPYPAVSPYGHGPWNHFLLLMDNHTGVLTMLLAPFGLFGWLVARKRSGKPKALYVALYALAIYGGIFLAHTWFWYTGTNASAGLTRVITMGLPGLILVLLVGCHYVTRELNSIPHIFAGLAITLFMVKEIRELPYPLKANPEEEQIIAAADFVGEHYQKEEIAYYHPLFIWRLNGGVKDTGTRFSQRSFANNPDYIRELKPGSIVVRDPHFGPTEMGFNQETIHNCGEHLKVLKRFPMSVPVEYKDNEAAEVVLYQVQ